MENAILPGFAPLLVGTIDIKEYDLTGSHL